MMAPLILAALKIAAGFAPEIIEKVAGEEAAGKVIEIAQAVTGMAAPDSALAALQADPAKALEFKQKVLEASLELDKACLADTKSARDRDVELAKAGLKNYRANALAGGAGFLVIFCLAISVWQSDLDDSAKAVITLILGRALGWIEQVFSFEFGTTRANKTKDDTINNLTK